jgi:hypothetical protein
MVLLRSASMGLFLRCVNQNRDFLMARRPLLPDQNRQLAPTMKAAVPSNCTSTAARGVIR